MNGKLVRSISLVIVIVSGLAFCAVLWLGFAQDHNMIVPAVAFTVIYAWILICEIWGATTGVKLTLSTRYKHWASEHPVLSWVCLALFWIAMSSLCVHLGVFW